MFEIQPDSAAAAAPTLAKQLLPFLPQAISFAAGFTTALFAEPIRQRLFAPKLSIVFGTGPDFTTETPEVARASEDDPGRRGQATYLRLRVRNDSFRLAKACRVFLVGVERADAEGRFMPTPFCDSIQLSWSVRDTQAFEAQDLARDIPYFVDLISFRDGTDVFMPHVRGLPFRYNDLFSTRGRYRFTVRVSGDGVKPARARIVVDWAGDRTTLRAESAA